MYSELYATGLFEEMTVSTDEDEHSIEMQLPYIAKVMERFGSKYCQFFMLAFNCIVAADCCY